MSKEAALRAMREARYNQRVSSPAPRRPAVAVAPPVPASAARAPQAPAADGLCGHRSMNGRTCTREHGHAAKSHRYS